MARDNPRQCPTHSALARRRAEVILKVRSGQMTVVEAAALLGVSRKTYYQWENRALDAMLEALHDRKPGRPGKPQEDPEKEALQKQVRQLGQKLILSERTLKIRTVLQDADAGSGPSERKGPVRRSTRKGAKRKPRR